MAGFGSPCGACKFLRRKCVKGCVFAPYFCHEQGATHFSAIHKVFGASNVSKLLTHLPVADRNEAAVTISYEAQARLQDPIYGCVSHIFALQQQVVNLQAQLASLNAQASQASGPQEDKLFSATFPNYLHGEQGLTMQQTFPNAMQNPENILCYENGNINPNSIPDYNCSSMSEGNSQYPSYEDSSFEMQMNTRKWAFQDAEDLQSMAFDYLQNS
ncbi:hypothetical protein ACHQM5_014362 [Ranunculus cassubicifolius]